MSERPFMQLYVSDFLGDTLELSTEGIGAYMLLLMAMWNANGGLPDDDAKLSRITRLSLKRWRAIAPDILSFFERVNGRITHHRLSKELQKSESKSQSRASAGSLGGAAKALKDKNVALAKATPLPQHLPETIYQNAAAQHSAGSMFYDKLIAAASSRGPCHPNLAMGIGPMSDLRRQNYTEAEIIEVVTERARPDIANWRYFVPIVVQRAQERASVAPKPQPPVEDWHKRMAVWRESRTWSAAWGPKPDEPKCRVPAELLRDAA